MDNMLYDALCRYFHALELKGYMPYKDMVKLLVLIFYRDFTAHDYRGLITRNDYLLIEKALDCLYGTSCLIPYPDYLKMGKLYLGQMTEMASRLKAVEDTPVLKLIHDTDSLDDPESDVTVTSSDSE